MTIDEIFKSVKTDQPQIVYITGKTSTGKSTFAARLHDELGYAVVNLDDVVADAVLTPLKLSDRGNVFVEVYKNRGQAEWIARFIAAAHKTISDLVRAGKPVVVDGAIAHPDTLAEVLAPFPGVQMYYFHPNNLDLYQKYLTNRFMLATADYQAGLPNNFWKLVDGAAFKQFCQDRVVSPSLAKSIQDYAVFSRQSSLERVRELQEAFPYLVIVEI